MSALALQAAWAKVPREPVVAYFEWLAREGLEREPSAVWNSLAADSAHIEAVGVFPELRRAYDDGLIEPRFMRRSELDQVEAGPRGHFLERMREQHPPIDDVVQATAWWGAFANERASRTSYGASAKVGRNEPCPCGSGKKYKKCGGH